MAEAYPDRESQHGETPFARERIQTDEQASEPSIARLLGDLVGDAQTLVRKEIELARQEFTNEIDKARQGAIALGVGAGITAIGGIFLLLMVVYMLATFFNLALWLAYLIVGGIITVIGVVMLITGMNRVKQVDPVPHETIDSVRKDVEWLKEQNPSDRI